MFFIDNLLVRIHFMIVMIRWTGLAPWEFELPFPGSRTSTFLATLIKWTYWVDMHTDSSNVDMLDERYTSVNLAAFS